MGGQRSSQIRSSASRQHPAKTHRFPYRPSTKIPFSPKRSSKNLSRSSPKRTAPSAGGRRSCRKKRICCSRRRRRSRCTDSSCSRYASEKYWTYILRRCSLTCIHLHSLLFQAVEEMEKLKAQSSNPQVMSKFDDSGSISLWVKCHRSTHVCVCVCVCMVTHFNTFVANFTRCLRQQLPPVDQQDVQNRRCSFVPLTLDVSLENRHNFKQINHN